jgi:hypothetical protein
MTTTNYSLGTLSSTPIQFSLSGTNNINLSLRGISAGDDADVSLYRDSNGNGTFDSSDSFVTSSSLGGNQDDSINYRASGGTYFAVVNRFSLGSDNRLTYKLDLSATATSQASNLLPKEIKVGNLSGDRTFSNQVGNTDTTDTYSFSLDFGEEVDINLSGLSNDADIRLIRDLNNNSLVDSGEVLGTSSNGGTSSDSLSASDAGNYFLQVYQYSGNTNYQLAFDYV